MLKIGNFSKTFFYCKKNKEIITFIKVVLVNVYLFFVSSIILPL